MMDGTNYSHVSITVGHHVLETALDGTADPDSYYDTPFVFSAYIILLWTTNFKARICVTSKYLRLQENLQGYEMLEICKQTCPLKKKKRTLNWEILFFKFFFIIIW